LLAAAAVVFVVVFVFVFVAIIYSMCEGDLKPKTFEFSGCYQLVHVQGSGANPWRKEPVAGKGQPGGDGMEAFSR
jgi:hypothetical protein